MITQLEALVDGAEGSYATTQDIRSLEHLMSSWPERKDAYLAVQAKEKEIIEQAIKLLQENQTFTDAKPVDGLMLDRCRRDMTFSLRSYALGMLLQDEEMLKDRVIHWQKNILQAMDLHNYQGVKLVYKAICSELTPEQANLLKPYFKLGQDMIMSN
jgi:Phycobilisome protein